MIFGSRNTMCSTGDWRSGHICHSNHDMFKCSPSAQNRAYFPDQKFLFRQVTLTTELLGQVSLCQIDNLRLCIGVTVPGKLIKGRGNYFLMLLC